jgi:16S rRNA (cytidine1402-2'-O)-methyltransferase
MAGNGTLYLIPTSLGPGDATQILPASTLAVLARLTTFVAENPRAARAFLRAAGYPHRLQEVDFRVLDEHTRAAELPTLLQPLLDGVDCGLLSEAGCPAVADPGAALVRLAHQQAIRVAPLVGPSSILLALMASGLDGQRFSFHGYLPVEAAARRKALLDLERASEREHRTQIFIEAPYRNAQLTQAILEACQGGTLLCLATDLTLATESVRTRTVSAWKAGPAPAISRCPTVFLLYRERLL